MKKNLISALTAVFIFSCATFFVYVCARVIQDESAQVLHVKGFVSASAKPVTEWVKYKREYARRISIPIVIENGTRGMVLNAYIPNMFYASNETITLGEFKDSYPPVASKKVFVVARSDGADLVIQKASLKAI